MAEFNPCLEFELEGFQNGWTDVTRDLRRSGGVRFDRGLPGVTPRDLVAKTGIMSFTLDNSEENSEGLIGLYSPGHANLRNGFDKNIGVRFRLHVNDAGVYRNEVLEDEPVAYWRLNDRSGTRAVDGTGSRHHGVYEGSPTLAQTGALNSTNTAVDFDGVDDNVNLGDNAALAFTGAFSVEAWIKYTAVGQLVIISKIDSSGSGWELRLNGSGQIVFRALTAAGATVFSINTTPAFNDSDWHLVQATWNGTTSANGVKLYVDGALEVQGTASAGTIGTPTDPARIGARRTTPAGFFDGMIDEVAAYDYELSAARCLAHFEAADVEEVTITLFTGRMTDITPSSGLHERRSVACTAADYMHEFTKKRLSSLEMETNILEQDVFSALVATMPLQPRSIEIPNPFPGADTLAYVFDTLKDERSAPMTEAQKLCQSTLARIFVKAGGMLVYEPRATRALNVSTNTVELTAADFPSDNVAGDSLKVTDDRGKAFNKFTATIHPRTPSDEPDVVLFQIEAPFAVAAGTQLTIRGLYTQPGQDARRAGGLDMLEAEPLTDYEFNTEPDGSGADATNDVSVTTIFTANSVLFLIEPNVNCYVIKLQARGTMVRALQNVAVEAEDDSSIENYGEIAFGLDMPYVVDPVFANEVVQYFLFVSQQNARRAEGIKMLLNGMTDERAATLLRRDISDRFGITDELTVLPISTRTGFFINAISFEYDEEGRAWLTWLPSISDATAYWYLEIPGQSELDATTRLGFGLIIGHTDIAHGDTHADDAHGDTAHSDVHGDDAHADGAHGDSTHTDVAHADTPHSDTVHSDTHADSGHVDVSHEDGHSDVAHSDNHTNVAHTDVHTDVAHQDVHGDGAHTDTAHTDFHVDNHEDFTGGHPDEHQDNHDDAHFDIAHEDTAHEDTHTNVAHQDVAHQDVAHQDVHNDGAHSDTHTDVSHQDSSHGDSHADVAHSDVAHVDTHTDVGHIDTVHQDTAHNDGHSDINHADAEHGDSHDDSPHGDAN
jgi:hypothetical protein